MTSSYSQWHEALSLQTFNDIQWHSLTQNIVPCEIQWHPVTFFDIQWHSVTFSDTNHCHFLFKQKEKENYLAFLRVPLSQDSVWSCWWTSSSWWFQVLPFDLLILVHSIYHQFMYHQFIINLSTPYLLLKCLNNGCLVGQFLTKLAYRRVRFFLCFFAFFSVDIWHF